MASVEKLTAPELGAWRGMLSTHARVVAVLDAELREAHDISLVEYEVLMYLLDAPANRLRMSDLADELLILSRSGLTRLVDRLEKAGLVRRRPSAEDGRGFFAELTPAGKTRVAAARRSHLGGVRRHFTSKLDAGELSALAVAWESIMDTSTGSPESS
jgi:DNA-binding MarR family transcriptional regulator